MAAPDQTGTNAQGSFLNFLEKFSQDAPDDAMSQNSDLGGRTYIEQLKPMKNNGKTTLYVDWRHVMEFDDELQRTIMDDFYRVEPYLCKAVEIFYQRYAPDEFKDAEAKEREFHVSFYNLTTVEKLRDLRVDYIGKLSAVQGTITRTSEVRPELRFGTFRCMDCGTVAANVEQEFKFTQPTICANATCSNRERWQLVREDCKFVDWQRVRMQESAEEVPAGSLPRSLDVILRNEIVEQARAGDKCVFTGQLVVVPDIAALGKTDRVEAVKVRGGGGPGGGANNMSEGVRGLKALGVRDLTYKLCFIASSVQMAENKFGLVNIRAEDEEDDETYLNNLEDAEREELARMREQPGLYDRLVRSIAPAVFGHADIKRAILLMLFGGVHKKTHEGINLRGDINVCIVGDPSCAKSQFLKYVAKFLPRAVYTSGKSSSAAGLTATVVKEPETGEFCIEAGALMLADNGICCIDEFDKMDVKDQVAIHEAMEQQTISIAKAGIQATLNARTSILAAANPAGGRYDRSKPLKYNVNLPPAILSRFDLVHVMIDEADDAVDYEIARHIVSVHQRKDAALHPDFSTVQLQRYIKYARTIKPELTSAAKEALIAKYVTLRGGDATPGSRVAYRITVRQLEAMIRLSEALARSECKHHILVDHVNKAAGLLKTSIIRVDNQEVDIEDMGNADEDLEEDYGVAPPDPPGGPDDDNDDLPPRPPSPASPPQATTSSDAPFPRQNGEAATPNRGAATPSVSRRESGAQAMDVDGGAVDGGDKSVGVKKRGREKKAERAKFAIPYEKYQKVADLLVLRLRQQEAAAANGDGTAGMRQGDLIRWYVQEENNADRFKTTQDVIEEYRLVRSVIQHLVTREATLIILDEGIAAVRASKEAAAAAKAAREAAIARGEDPSTLPPVPPERSAIEERILAVNPNYTGDEKDPLI